MGGGDVDSDSSIDVGDEVSVNIQCSNGSKFAVQVNLNSTVEFFKSILAQNCQFPAQQQRLIYRGRILKDDQTLQSYGVPQAPAPQDAADGVSEAQSLLKSPEHTHRAGAAPPRRTQATAAGASLNMKLQATKSLGYGDVKFIWDDMGDVIISISMDVPHKYLKGIVADHTVHLVRSFASTTDAGVRSANSVSTPDADSGEGGPRGGSGFGSSLFPGLSLNGLGSGSGLFGVALPEMEQMQRQLPQNPDMIGDAPLHPHLTEIPETIRDLIMNNPQMLEAIDRNPELAHVLDDPATLRQTMEAARNPEIMREMMRNTDREMNHIESSPEGFNMLRRMYENVQEPLLNSTTMTDDSSFDLGSDEFPSLLEAHSGRHVRENSNSTTPNTNPLPNPWVSAGIARNSLGTQTNSDARLNRIGIGRPVSRGGLGGLGFPDLVRMIGSRPDRASFNQLGQNPTISRMMRNIMSTPQYMNQILRLNPQLQSMLDSNPQLRDTMQNPEFIRQLTSPEMMQWKDSLIKCVMKHNMDMPMQKYPLLMESQQLRNFHRALSSQLARQTSLEPGQNAGGTVNSMGLDMLMNLFGGLGTAGGITTPNRSQVPPEELYAPQLSQLQEMGFPDAQENIRALNATAGNVHAAVERLLGNPGQ
ncbi:hypothetical protein DH2020_015231 [Rehmannia glutinosa]|uniref:Uncharacterized protein n=1 Tax=Rehmannia glutinosa TaxID=99300 RepID=A0ABR0WVI9_REHGL